MTDGCWSQKRVRTHVTYFGRDIFEDDHVRTALDGMNDEPMFVIPGTTLDTAFHSLLPLCNGVTHLGGFGSYTVLYILSTFCQSQEIGSDGDGIALDKAEPGLDRVAVVG